MILPIALFAGRQADRWGRKPILLIGFAILPVRAFLYTLSNDSGWLIAVQLLDGVGAGIYGVLTPLVVVDLMRGTGRFNLALGVVATTHGIGASLSGFATGLIVDHFGYRAAFLSSGGVAGIALSVLLLLMPETARAPQPFGMISPSVPCADPPLVTRLLRRRSHPAEDANAQPFNCSAS